MKHKRIAIVSMALMIFLVIHDPPGTSFEPYETPTRHGALRVISEQNNRLALMAAGGSGYSFDLSSRQFIESLPGTERSVIFPPNTTPSPLPAAQIGWLKLYFPVLPSPRVSAAFVLNSNEGIALLFGGINATSGELNDLWSLDGNSWTQLHPLHLPESRSDMSLAYDELHNRAVLFGGIGAGSHLGDTWTFDGTDWAEQKPPVSPSPRTAASMAYDAERQVTLLFGGLKETSESLNDMWFWDGETWQQQYPADLPQARWGAELVYDRARKSILLFGGASVGGFLEDTWLWDGEAWVEQHPQHHPGGRANFGMAYDEGSQQVVLFGGQTYLDVDPTETWAWDGQDWAQLPTRQAPSKEMAYGAQLVYLPDLQSVVLYNDFRDKTSNPDDTFTSTDRSEVWALTGVYPAFLPFISKQRNR